VRLVTKLARFAAPAVLVSGLLLAAGGTAQASQPCFQDGFLCYYLNTGYGGTEGQVSQNNPNFTQIAKSGGGNWNDKISSAYNDGSTDSVALYQSSGYTGFAECILMGSQTGRLMNFTKIADSASASGNFNDQASSDFWYTPGGEPPGNCFGTD
jgi:Peptidase inhibitor family I36